MYGAVKCGTQCLVDRATPEYVAPCTSHQLVFVGARKPRKNWITHIAASHSRQPLVKGERLVRYEVNAVMLGIAACGDKTWKPQRNEVVRWPASPDARPLAERFVRRWMSRNLGCNREAQPQTVSAITFEFAMCLHGGLRGGCLVRPIRAALRALRPQEQIA